MMIIISTTNELTSCFKRSTSLRLSLRKRSASSACFALRIPDISRSAKCASFSLIAASSASRLKYKQSHLLIKITQQLCYPTKPSKQGQGGKTKENEGNTESKTKVWYE